MTQWVDVDRVATFLAGQYRVVEVEDVLIAVFNVDGDYYAIEDTCTHDGGTLTGGSFSDSEIICPRHGARFCVRTGAVLSPPAYEDVACFPTRIHNGVVQVRDNRWD